MRNRAGIDTIIGIVRFSGVFRSEQREMAASFVLWRRAYNFNKDVRGGKKKTKNLKKSKQQTAFNYTIITYEEQYKTLKP